MKYKKGSYWTDGGATVLPLDTDMIVRKMLESLCIFDGKTLVWEIFRQEGIPLPAPADLPGVVPEKYAHLLSSDPATWQLGPSGRPSCPVQPTFYVTWLERKTLKDYTFLASSWGGQVAVRDLARQIAVREAQAGGKIYAVIRLQSGERKSAKYDLIKEPRFPVVDWLDASLRPLPKEPPATLDDDIAF